MQAIFMAVFAALIVAADQITKYLTATNIRYIFSSNSTITQEAIQKFNAAFHITEAQVAAMPDEIPAIKGIFHFSHTFNDGAAWSSFAGMQWLFAVIFVLLTVGIVWEYKKQSLGFSKAEWWCIAAIYGGGLGNMIDRVRFGFVVDMIELDFISFPVFNVADCFITCGCIALLVHLVFFNKGFWKDNKK